MNTSFEKNTVSTDEWYTPKWIIDALGVFDLDPCASGIPGLRRAITEYTKDDDGLSKKWFGRVWLNPPYSRPLIEKFMYRMAEHNNGVALIFNRADSKLFHETIFDKASALLFLKGRIKFLRADGTEGGSPGCGSVLVAYGQECAEAMRDCCIPGKYIRL